MTPTDKITKKLSTFRPWLTANGAGVLEPTNQWEVVRFKSGDETCVIYRNAKCGNSFSSVNAELAWNAFRNGKAWRAAVPTSRRKSMTPEVRAIRVRDGDLCFYCQAEVSGETESAEHLVSVTHGGPNHLSNLFLAHRECNARAGHLSAPEKIAIHTRAVLAKANAVHATMEAACAT